MKTTKLSERKQRMSKVKLKQLPRRFYANCEAILLIRPLSRQSASRSRHRLVLDLQKSGNVGILVKAEYLIAR
jgi:hypothetical protein